MSIAAVTNEPPDLARRGWLADASRAAAAMALSALFAPPATAGTKVALQRTGGSYPFALGVASSIAGANSVVLWTRLAPHPYEPFGGMTEESNIVRWELADDEHFSRGVRRGGVLTHAEHAHCAHVLVNELNPDSTYYYRFISGDATSPTGRARTAPAPDGDLTRLRLALASCQHYEQGSFAVHREIATRDYDFVLFVGDYIYESSNQRYKRRPHEGPVPYTLDAYRARHATYKLDPDLRASHAAHPWLFLWDDHEVENDYAGERGFDSRSPVDFLVRRTAAYKAYFEHMPIAPARAPRGPNMLMHGKLSWGRLADLWLLDCRQFRSAQACLRPGRGGRPLVDCEELGDERRSVLGEMQECWLAEGMAASESQWRLVAQASQIARGAINTPLGPSIYSDTWDGYPKAREHLLRTLARSERGNVIALGGDVHRHSAANLRVRPNDESSPVVASEIVATSLTTSGLPEAVASMVRSANPDIVHCRGDERGYVSVEVTPRLTLCDFRATTFPVRDDASLHTQARYVVEAGRAGVRTD